MFDGFTVVSAVWGRASLKNITIYDYFVFFSMEIINKQNAKVIR